MVRNRFFAAVSSMVFLMVAGVPARADVKAGVDAWGRGDYPFAVREWQADAAKGDTDAQFNLGQAYRLGRGVPQDMAKAEDLFGKAAAAGHIQASDNYGLLLFQRGQRAQALPFIRAAADRGDARAQYLLGIAHFNGDMVTKDWTRAYALVSLAQQNGLAQAQSALAQMDQHIPLAQRQEGVALASELRSQADATRARQMTAADLGPAVAAPAIPAPPMVTRVQNPPTVSSARDAVADAARIAGTDSPASAGADYTRRPNSAPAAPARPAVAATRPQVAPPATAAQPAPQPAAGSWRVQLGAFGVAANADALWNKVRARPEVAGHPRINVRAGAATKLQAGGYASEAEARSACARLSAAGFTCLATRG